MSVLLKVKHAVRSIPALRVACQRLGLKLLPHGTHKVWNRPHVGYGLNLPGWKYTVVVDDISGTIIYDNHNGSWGRTDELDSLLQAYTVAAIEEDAEKTGQKVVQSIDVETGEVILDLEIVSASDY